MDTCQKLLPCDSEPPSKKVSQFSFNLQLLDVYKVTVNYLPVCIKM